MAKKARRGASKARKAKVSARPKRSTLKTRRKLATPKTVKLAAKRKPARKRVAQKKPEAFSRKVADAFKAVVDTLVDAEQLHHKLDPEVSREPE